jgi:type II secretory pathway component PulK
MACSKVSAAYQRQMRSSLSVRGGKEDSGAAYSSASAPYQRQMRSFLSVRGGK